MSKDKEVKMQATPYYFHDSDDEDDDTYQTRKSLKTAEKQYKTRFFMTKGEQERFEKNKKEGKLDPKVATFEEKGNEDPGAIKEDVDAKEAAKKKTASEEAAEKVEKKEAGVEAAEKAEEFVPPEFGDAGF